MFVNEQNPGEAISAVKALQKASAAGQRIYHITQTNQSTILANIHHDADTMAEIRNALNAGKEVITHTDAVSVPGWSGAGYIITDPDTGSGAYKIAGGGNGGFLIILGFLSIFLFAMISLSLFSISLFTGISALYAVYGIAKSYAEEINEISSLELSEEKRIDRLSEQTGYIIFRSLIGALFVDKIIRSSGFERDINNIWKAIANMYFLVFDYSFGPKA